MSTWTPFLHVGEYRHTVGTLKKHWTRLHACDREPLPDDSATLQAWVLFHNGKFEQAAQAGLAAGTTGLNVANKATGIYATYLENDPQKRTELLLEVAQRAEQMCQDTPDNPNAWFWQAYALGRHSNDISVALALAQGLGTRVRAALEKTLQLEPQHADAHIALGAFHAEVIDKVGALIGRMTYGAKKEDGLRHYQNALRLNPHSPVVMLEYANALLMMEGERCAPDDWHWRQKAAACTAADALERLGVELARQELAQ